VITHQIAEAALEVQKAKEEKKEMKEKVES
jgi:hypothetical protein